MGEVFFEGGDVDGGFDGEWGEWAGGGAGGEESAGELGVEGVGGDLKRVEIDAVAFEGGVEGYGDEIAFEGVAFEQVAGGDELVDRDFADGGLSSCGLGEGEIDGGIAGEVELEAGGGEEGGECGEIDGLGVGFGGAVEGAEGFERAVIEEDAGESGGDGGGVAVAGFGLGGEVEIGVVAGGVEDALGG